jgi:predicted nucleic acid-binding protein
MARVFWDTNLFIYLMEAKGKQARVQQIRRTMLARGDELLTSALTLGELLVKPKAEAADDLVRSYERLVTSAATVLPFDAAGARRFAEIRATTAVKAADAIQLACAAHAQVDLFITNDDRLSRLVVPGIHFISSLDRVFL